MPGLTVPESTTRTQRRASSTAVNTHSPKTPDPRRPGLPKVRHSEPTNLPTRPRSRRPAVSSRAPQARSVTNSPKTSQENKRVQDRAKSSSKGRSVDDSETDTTDPATSEDSDAEGDECDIESDVSPPGTPCPTCHRVSPEPERRSQSSSRSPSPGDLFDSIESDSDPTLGFSNLSLESEADSPNVPIDFQQFNEQLERSPIHIEVFDTIQETQGKKKVKRLEYGFIYILEDKQQPSCLKIGMTKNHPQKRSRQIRQCKVVRTELVRGQDYTIVPWYKRLERIIFADLWNERQCFECTCGTQHEEWFKMSKEEALLRVRLWQTWMLREPYDSQGVLKCEWQNRIEAIRRDQSYGKTIEAEHASGNLWQRFMEEFPDTSRS